jgi:hypothetical protein
MFLAASIASTLSLHAQAPAAGTTVAVKMIDTVNSASDPAGRQYRALVARAVDAGNGVSIAQGAAATVTLTSSGSGYTAQLSSITINGRQVAVASNSATVSAVAQVAQEKAVSAANSVLGGFGHHVSAPAAVAAAASGQHVSLPTGTTLTFVLGASPAAPPAAPAAQTMTASAASAPAPASSSASTSSASASEGITTLVVCYSNINSLYLSAAFEASADRYGDATLAFSNYLQATYHYSMGVKCLPMFTTADVGDAQKQLAGFAAKLKAIDTGWRLGQPPLSQGQSGFNPLAQGPGGIDLSQHRLTTYFCSYTAAITSDPIYPNHTMYISQLFQADWNPAPVSMAYKVFIRDHYVHDLTVTDLSPRCNAQSPAMQTMQHQTAMISNKRIGKAVAVDFTDTPAQAAAGHAAAAPSGSAAPASASTGGPYISCSTSGGAGTVIYLTGIFQTTKPVRYLPNGAKIVDQSVLNDFYAYLTQKGYNFKPGNIQGCDVSPTEAAAKTAQHTRVYGGSGSCGYCGNKVVETGWTE